MIVGPGVNLATSAVMAIAVAEVEWKTTRAVMFFPPMTCLRPGYIALRGPDHGE